MLVGDRDLNVVKRDILVNVRADHIPFQSISEPNPEILINFIEF